MNHVKQSMLIILLLVVALLEIAMLCMPLKLNDEWTQQIVEPMTKLEGRELSVSDFEEILDQFLSTIELSLYKENSIQMTEISDTIYSFIQELDDIKLIQLEKKVVWAEFFEKSKAYAIELNIENTDVEDQVSPFASINFFIITKHVESKIVITYVSVSESNLIK
ncbi:MAG: hypothetical protein ACRCST_12700 [Turicibacter sp.]